MKEVPANKKKSLGKLPTPVRNKMGYMEDGGSVPKAKKPKINISREEFENQTREERAAYNRLVKEMDRKNKEAGEKAKDRPFNKGGKVKGYAPGGTVKRSKAPTGIANKRGATPSPEALAEYRKKMELPKTSRYSKKLKEMRKAGKREKMPLMKKGGKVKGYEHGGSVKGKGKCRMDGIAIRGKTRAKQRSR